MIVCAYLESQSCLPRNLEKIRVRLWVRTEVGIWNIPGSLVWELSYALEEFWGDFERDYSNAEGRAEVAVM